MLIRALFISVLLHLGLLLSQSSVVRVPLQRTSGDVLPVIKIVLGRRDGVGLPLFADQKLIATKTNSQTTIKQNTSSSKTTEPHSNFGGILPSTVRVQEAMQSEPSLKLDVSGAGRVLASAEAISEYRLNVARMVRQFSAYPLLARGHQWEGVVEVSVTLPIGNEHPVVELGHSSGYEILDRQALDMVKQAVGLAMRPDGVRGRNLTVSLPVEFRLVN